MRTARENELISSTIYLGLLATRLKLLLVSSKSLESRKINVSLLTDWSKILNDTIEFLGPSSAVKQQIVNKPSIAPRFLARAPYLEQLCDAVPNDKRRQPKELTSYLKKVHDNINKLQEGASLDSKQEQELLRFVNTVAEHSLSETYKFQHEPHPIWPRRTELARR